MVVNDVSWGKRIWDKLSESAKATILVNTKTPHKPSSNVNFHDVTLGYLIKDIHHKFDFSDTNNYSYSIDQTIKANYTDGNVNDAMILTKISKREKVSPAGIQKVIYGYSPSYIKKLKDITIDEKLYHQVKTSFIYVANHNNINWQ